MADSAACEHRFVAAKVGWAEGAGWRSIFVVLRCSACGSETQRTESRIPWPPVETVVVEPAHAG